MLDFDAILKSFANHVAVLALDVIPYYLLAAEVYGDSFTQVDDTTDRLQGLSIFQYRTVSHKIAHTIVLEHEILILSVEGFQVCFSHVTFKYPATVTIGCCQVIPLARLELANGPWEYRQITLHRDIQSPHLIRFIINQNRVAITMKHKRLNIAMRIIHIMEAKRGHRFVPFGLVLKCYYLNHSTN